MQQDPLSDINLTPRVSDGSNPYLVEAQRQANEIRQPGIGGSTANAGSAQNPYLTFLQQPAEAPSQSPAIASIAGTMSINPDQAAQASRLGKEFGLGQDIALRNMEELRRRSLIYSLERNGTMNRNPVLAQWMMNPANAAMAHDDISSLSRLEKIEEYLYALPEEFGAGFSTGQIQVATGKIGSNAMVRGLPTSEEWQAWNAYQSELQTLSGDAGFWRQTGELVGQMASTGKDVLEAATVGALYGGTVAAVGGQLGPQVVIPEEILTVPAGMIIGAKAGAVGALFTSSARTMAGNNYMKNLEIGRDPDISRFTALGVGVIGGALETYGTKLVAKPLGGLWSRLVSEAANEAIVKPTVGKAMAKAGIEWLKATGGEIGTETAQQITEIALDEVNGFASDPAFESRFATEEGRRGIKNELVDVFVRTAMGVSVVGSIGPGANLLIDTRRASRAKNSQRVIAETVAAIDATKLKARNPDALEEYADDALDETQAYIRGSTLRQLLTDAKVSDADLDAIVPGLSARVREAETTGNFVSMPLAQFGVRFGGTPLGNAMVPHLTIDPRAMTPTELAAFERERQELTAEAEKLLEAKTATDEAFVQEADEIHASVKQRLVTAGRDELAADAEATIYQAMIVTAAAREGMTPQQYADQYGLREIVGDGQAAQEQALEQAVTPAPESGVFDVNNPPTAKPGMRDISQGPAIVALMDYDGTVYYDVNATMHGDLIDTFPEIADTVIDGGFIINGKYVPNISDGGYAAMEGGDERMAEVRRFTEQVNTRKPPLFEQAAVQQGEQATLERLQMQAQRGVRRQARKVELSPMEEAAIANAASEFGESAAEIREAVLNHKKAHPTAQGWAPLEFVKLAPKRIEDKGKKGLGLEKLELQYRQIPYAFHRDATGTALQAGTPEYQTAVTAIARRMVDEVRAVLRRANAGDQNALRIINQSTWYKAMRAALRREFGGLGDLFADLLGATSPNTPVRGNWDFALDVLRRAARGDFDDVITKWEAWVETIERLETDLRAYINDEMRAMEARGEKPTQAAIQRKPEYVAKLTALKEARELPDDLLPRQENGKKYGFNGGNIVRSMVGLWRTVREQNTLLGTSAQAPKALNFSGNLIGFRARATIDVWAARMLQRLAALLRIPSMAETGVEGDMLPDGSTTGQFGFGQDVFAEAAQRIRNDAELNQNSQLAQLNDDDLQALVWFIEKELWTINNWTSVAGEGGSFELEASLAGISDQEMVTKLRKTIDASVPSKLRAAANRLPAAQQALINWKLDPAKAGWRQRIADLQAELDAVPTTLTKKEQRERRSEITERLDNALRKSGLEKIEQTLVDAIKADTKVAQIEEARKAAQAKLISMERRVDRYTAGLSQQQSMDSQGVDYIPTDADQARLADNVRLRAYRADLLELLVAIKAMATEGRYGAIERSIDLEVIAREGWSPSELWRVMLEEAKDARQESTFLSRVLRANEAIDPAQHRPGLEIYFRSPIPRDKLDALIEKLNANGVDFFTVIVDARRSTAARAGAMADAVGIRMQYVPEYMQRYGIEDFSGLSETEIADRVKAKEAEWLLLADQVLRVMPEVSFAGVFWHETRVAFADSYEREINAITTGTATGDGGLLAGTQWTGQSVSEGIAAANRFVESRTARAEPDGGGQVSRGVQEGDRVGFAEPGIGDQLQQAARGGPRGGFDPQRMRMFLTSKQDASTTIHELMHFALQSMTDLARSGNASPQVLADLDLLFQWRKEAIAGDTPQARLATWLAMPIDQQRTALQEPLAYNGEIYVFEGKAPTEKLQPVFDRLRAFMLRVYKSIRDEINAIYRQQFGEDLPMLTPEVRGVFDRILASDNQIRQQAAVNEMRPQFQTQEQSGMDDATWAAYQEMQQEAMDASITDLSKASLRQMQWLSGARAKVLRDMQEKHEALRKEVTVEMAAAVRVDKVYRALTFLRYGKFIDEDGQEVEIEGPHKLDLETVKQMYELEPEALRPDVTAMARGKYGFVGTDGLDPDMVAEMFGYTSGDQMIRAVLAAKPIKEEIKARTDAEMTRRYGDMNTRQAQEAEVQKALHNEARARMVAVELRWAAKMQQPVRVLLDAAKSAAEQVIGRKRIRDLRPSEFVTAETQAAREATGLMQMRDPSVAAQAAATKAYNEAVAAGRTVDEATAESMAAGVAAADKARTQLAEFDARYPGMTREQRIYTAKRHQLLNNQMARAALQAREQVDKDVKYLRRVLRDKSVERMGADAADQIAQLLERFEVAAVSLKRLDERKNLAQYMAEMEEQGLVPNIAPKLIAETNRVNYREMTVDQFNDLVEAVKQIEYIGKNARKLQLANERVAFNDKRDEIVTRIRATGRLRGLDLDPRSPLTNIGRTIARLQSFAAAHLKAASVAFILDGGKDDGPLWNTVIRTANDAADMETRMRSEATAKLAEILKPVFALGRMGGKGKFFQSVNRSLNREAVIAIALNMGNAGNMQRLLDGEGWTMDQVQPILQSLTVAEWNAVQQVWDYLETYRPLIAAKERRLYGKEPNWVEPQPLTVQTADGQSLTLRGGYYTVKYDPVASDRVAMVDEVQEAKDALRGTYTAATTRRSFTKDRAEKVVGRPILYTLDAAFSGVNDVIHDLAWHEWLISTNRLLRDETFANAVRETRGPEFLRQLREWAKSNAAGDRPANVEGVLSWLRQGISASGLGFNVMSAALQITGFNQSVVRVGAKWVGLGIAEFTASPFATSQFVRDNSMFMAERQRTQFRELNELRNTVRGKSGVRRVLAQAYVAMMTMQRAVDTPTWVGAYRKALAGGKDHATAVALADQAVKDSQGSGLTSDLAAIERGGPGLKLFTVFYGYMNTVYNMAAMQTYTARGRGKLAADYVLLLVVPVVLSHAIKAALTPDTGDDEFDPEALARKLAAEELSYLMGTMVVVREFGGAAEIVAGAEGVRMGYGGPAGVRAIGEAYNLATQTQQGEFDRAWFRSAINTLGAFTGLPSAQINRTIDGVEAILEDEVEGVEAVVAPVTGVKR